MNQDSSCIAVQNYTEIKIIKVLANFCSLFFHTSNHLVNISFVSQLWLKMYIVLMSRLYWTMTLSLRDASIIITHLGQRSVEGNDKGCRAAVATSEAGRSTKATRRAHACDGVGIDRRCKTAPIVARVLADFPRITQGAGCAREDARRARALPGTDSLCNLTHTIAHKLCDFIFLEFFYYFWLYNF